MIFNYANKNFSRRFQSVFCLGKLGLACLAVVFLLCGCEEQQEVKVKIHTSYAGDVEILNSCGIDGAASGMRDYLRRNGFDVVSYGDYPVQNFDETVLAVHTPDWEGAKPLAEALNTKNVLYIKNKRAYVDATVYIGKDFQSIIQQDSP